MKKHYLLLSAMMSALSCGMYGMERANEEKREEAFDIDEWLSPQGISALCDPNAKGGVPALQAAAAGAVSRIPMSMSEFPSHYVHENSQNAPAPRDPEAHDEQRNYGMVVNGMLVQCSASAIALEEKKQFQCSQCLKRFARHRGLARHVRIHTGYRPFKCQECKSAFTEKGALTKHIKRVHRRENRYICAKCGWGCFDRYILKRHMKKHIEFHLLQEMAKSQAPHSDCDHQPA